MAEELGAEVTRAVAEALLPSHVAVTADEPGAIPANSPFPLDERMVVSAALQTQFVSGTRLSPLNALSRTLAPTETLTVAGKISNIPDTCFPEPSAALELPQPIEGSSPRHASRVEVRIMSR